MKQVLCSLFFILPVAVTGQQHYNGPVIDMHVHVAVLPGESGNLGAPNTIQDILPLLKPANMAGAGIITIAHAGNMEETRRRNDSIMALHRRYPELIPICSVHPADTTAAWEELVRLHKEGVRVIKLHPNAQHFDVASPQLAALAEKAGELHMVLLFDSFNPEDASELGKLMMLAVTHLQTRFILAHMGFVHFRELLTIEAWKRYSWYRPNLWFDISAIAPVLGSSPDGEQLVWTIRKIGIEQCLYGSDFPLFTFKESVAAVQQLGFTEKEEQLILHDNAVGLLNLVEE